MKVSVIIPCYNGEPYIAQTIGSVLEQSQPPAEVIVVDDGSTDDSARIARSFGEQVQVISRRCGGGSKARNYGYRFATGEAIMFLDADDVLGPQALEALTATLDDGSIAICPWHRLEKEGEIWVKRPADCRPFRHSKDHLANWLTGWWHPPCSVLWSRSAFERTGGWDQRSYVNDDGELIMRALVADTPLRLSPRGAAYYRRLPEAETSVSDRRFTRAGITARIYAARKIALLLEQEQKADGYRQALREKFEEIADDCAGTFPELHERCYRYADLYGEPQWRQSLRRNAKSTVRRLLPVQFRKQLKRAVGKLNEEDERRSTPEVSPSPAEVRYGLQAASEADASTQSAPQGSSDKPNTSVSDEPEVSVIIPSYNRAELIGRAIDSVLEQTFQDFEVVVVDDGSTDNTSQIVGSYDDSRIRYFVQPENQGVASARNRGMREAYGRFIAFLDSDDEWFPDKLEKQLAQFETAPEDVGLVYCGVETIKRDGGTRVFSPTHRGSVYEKLLLDNVIHTGSGTMIRRSVIRTVGFFNEEIPAHEDYDYWLRIARFYHFDFVDEPLIRYYDVASDDRKTLDTQANLDARHWFFNKYRSEMRAAGVDYLFLVETARWHLTWGSNRPMALLILLRAMAKAPFKLEGYHLLAQVLLPYKIYKRLLPSRA